MTKKIDTPTARAGLKPRRDPYWHKLEPGRFIGFRAGAGTWVARQYEGKNPKAPYVFKALDDIPFIAPREQFAAAKTRAEEWFATLGAGVVAHFSIDDAVADYVEHRRLEKGEASSAEAKQQLHKSVIPKFKGREVSSLTTDELKRWRNAFVPRSRHGDEDDDAYEERKRRAKETANRNWAGFRAALNLAFQSGKVARDTEWRRVKPFEDTGAARKFYPTPKQVGELLDHCAADFRLLAHASALTGFRLQALAEARVADFDPKGGTLTIRKDKKHARDATLSSDAVALFKEQAKDKLPSAHLFLRADGFPWGKSHQHRPFRAACKAAKLPREFILYSLRHYYISRALLAGMNVQALAKNVGTSTRMIERHYAKFIKSDVREMLDRVEVVA